MPCSNLKGRLLYCTTSREKRIVWELAELVANSSTGYSIGLKDDSAYEWLITLAGPRRSPYEGGIFFLDVHFPRQYPSAPPIIKFRTAIYHCNIDNLGTIQLDILYEKWSPTLTMTQVMSCIMDLMTEPLPDQALVTDTVRHYLKSPEHYGLIAREWTKRFVEATVNSQLFCSNIALYTIKHLAVHIEAKVEKNKKVTTWLYHTLLSSSHKFAHVVYHES